MTAAQNRITNIRRTLRATYPNVKTQLRHENPFELLIATILSAQCTDKQVNAVTPKLFAALKTPEDFIRAPLAAIEHLIRSTGYYHNKARHIQNCCRTLIERHHGVVPKTLEELVQLPGVGRKTANVVLGAAFGIPGMVVDTHVTRIANRLGLTRHKHAVKIEADLMELIPQAEWNRFGLQLICFGREFCQSRKPECPRCPLTHTCRWPGRTKE